MNKKKYWQGLEELNPTASFENEVANEFKEELPFEDLHSIAEANTSRRDFLKYLGFTTVAATIAASCEMPVRKAIPYAIKPENITPGVPLMYASTFIDGGEALPILVKVRDGRPIKIEGNKDSQFSQGVTNARAQASVLNLYDIARVQHPMIGGKKSTWKELDAKVAQGLTASAGKQNFIITSTVNSPMGLSAINAFAQKNGAKHIMFDAVSYSGMLDANLASTGKRALPTYHFENAKTIVSIGADFLGTWINPALFSKQYAMGRNISAKNIAMSKHFQIEGVMSLTGASADERTTCRPSEYGAVVAAIYNEISGTKNSFKGKLSTLISEAAKELKASGGKGLLVCGSNDAAVQTLVNAINSSIGAYGNTISTSVSDNSKQGNDAEMNLFLTAVKNNQVGAVIFYDCNPVQEHSQGAILEKALKNIPLSVSISERMDETANACQAVAASHHFLESWGDAEPASGYYSFIQPTINPLFDTRNWAENFMKWSGDNTDYATAYETYWSGKLGGQTAFDTTVQLGFSEPGAMAISGSASANAASAIAIISAMPKADASKPELVIYEKVSIGRGGAWSNNPWLQEMPDPISKCTWDNYIMISPKRAKDMGAEWTDLKEVIREKHVFKIKTAQGELDLPVLVQPGMHDDVVAVALGYGRVASVGKAANDTGKNAAILLDAKKANVSNYISNIDLSNTGKTYPLAIVQTHFQYENARPIVHEFTFDEFKKNPRELVKERQHALGHYTHSFEAKEEHGEHGAAHGEEKAHGEHDTNNPNFQEDYRNNGTLYDMSIHEAMGLKWGMSIDLNSCTGCGACTIACQAENNISVVGKEQVLKAHEMHWIRIDRYFSGDPYNSDDIQTIFQPMICQHCDNAPCENVCPVNATNHSNEGINQMAYNRCIGTRYCANNCPYKVRRFNWRDWNEADSFGGNVFTDGKRDDINNDITRMVLNPDVTVRSRGVMEKCTFCVQRLQSAKAEAKKGGKVLADGAAQTACQTSCPTNAITFGNVNDKQSAIAKIRNEDQAERVFYSLEEIHTLPSVNYLSKIRNTSKILCREEATTAHHEEHTHG